MVVDILTNGRGRANQATPPAVLPKSGLRGTTGNRVEGHCAPPRFKSERRRIMAKKEDRGFEGQSVGTNPQPKFNSSLKERLLGRDSDASRGYKGGFSSVRRILQDVKDNFF